MAINIIHKFSQINVSVNYKYYDITNVYEGIDINKTSASKEGEVCNYWYFPDKGFMFQSDVCNICQDELMMSMKLSNIAILNINSSNYRSIIKGISKSEAIKLLQNAGLTENVELCKT